MHNNLEDFIEHHREELDIYEPPQRIWDGINKQLPNKKKRKFAAVYLAAACISFIICGAISFFVMRNGGGQKAALLNTEIVATVMPAPEITEAESYYTSIVSTNLSQLATYSNDYPELCNTFKAEIDTLSKMYAQLKEEYNKSMGNEAVLQAMVDNMQKQVSILKMQMEVIRQVKHQKNTTNTSNKKTKFI